MYKRVTNQLETNILCEYCSIMYLTANVSIYFDINILKCHMKHKSLKRVQKHILWTVKVEKLSMLLFFPFFKFFCYIWFWRRMNFLVRIVITLILHYKCVIQQFGSIFSLISSSQSYILLVLEVFDRVSPILMKDWSICIKKKAKKSNKLKKTTMATKHPTYSDAWNCLIWERISVENQIDLKTVTAKNVEWM